MKGLTAIELTVDEFAQVERVSTRQVRNWITKGALEVRRTTGGGVRIIERRIEVHERAVFFSMKPDEQSGNLSK